MHLRHALDALRDQGGGTAHRLQVDATEPRTCRARGFAHAALADHDTHAEPLDHPRHVGFFAYRGGGAGRHYAPTAAPI